MTETWDDLPRHSHMPKLQALAFLAPGTSIDLAGLADILRQNFPSLPMGTRGANGQVNGIVLGAADWMAGAFLLESASIVPPPKSEVDDEYEEPASSAAEQFLREFPEHPRMKDLVACTRWVQVVADFPDHTRLKECIRWNEPMINVPPEIAAAVWCVETVGKWLKDQPGTIVLIRKTGRPFLEPHTVAEERKVTVIRCTSKLMLDKRTDRPLWEFKWLVQNLQWWKLVPERDLFEVVCRELGESDEAWAKTRTEIAKFLLSDVQRWERNTQLPDSVTDAPPLPKLSVEPAALAPLAPPEGFSDWLKAPIAEFPWSARTMSWLEVTGLCTGEAVCSRSAKQLLEMDDGKYPRQKMNAILNEIVATMRQLGLVFIDDR